MNKLISVILTSYNHERYLPEAIESVLNQTFKDFELIIVDDCSSDGSWNIIQSYKDKRIISVKNPVNMRIKSLKNIVFNFTKGKYIAIHHSDDVWEPTKLEKQVAFLESHPEYAACFTQVEFIDEESQHYDLPEGHFFRAGFEKENRTKEAWLNYFFYKGNGLCHPSVLIQKEMYSKYDLLDFQGLAQVPDFSLWVKLCLNEEIYILQEYLIKFRLRRTAQENTSADKPEVHIRSEYEWRKIIDNYLKITDEEMFLKVFPDAIQFKVKDQICLEFALAQIALKISRPVYRLFGLDLLYSLINDPVQAKKIEKLYQYTYKDFIMNTAAYDVFNIKKNQKFIHPSLYIDYGAGFNEEDKLTQEVYVSQNQQFYIEYCVKNNGPIKRLRFDPTVGECVKVIIDQATVNEENMKLCPLNGIRDKWGYDVFSSFNPQYEINCMGKNTIILKIYGRVEESVSNLVAEREKLMIERDRVTMERDEAIAERDEVIAERDEVIAERDDAIAQREAIINTRGYRSLQKLRSIKSKLGI